MKKIISISGDKGGTGKSVVSSAVLDTALACGKTVLLVEADTKNPDLAKAYGEAVETVAVCLDNREGFIQLASLAHKTAADVVLINNPARSGWNEFGSIIANNVGEMGAELVVLWVANRQVDSVELLADFHAVFTQTPVFFVKNTYWGGPEKFEIWNGSKIRDKIFAAGGGEINFPDCADRVMAAIRNGRLRWDQVNELDFGEKIEAERVRHEFQAAFAQIVE